MKLQRLIRHLVATAFMAGFPTCLAQEADRVALQFISFPKAANPQPVELLVGGDQTIEVELPTNSISQTYHVPALSTWSLGKSSTDPEGKFTFQSYGAARSIGENEQLILVIRRGGDDAAGLSLAAFKNSADGFGGGKYLMVNASSADIAGSVGTSEFALRPRGHRLIAPNPTSTHQGREYAFTKFHYRINEDVQPFFSATWRFNRQARSMVFFYNDPDTRHLRVHTIRSFVR